MHLSPSVAKAAVRSKAVVLLLTCCLLLLPLWETVIVLCFVVRYFMSILVLQSSWLGRESWLLCFVCLPGVSWLLCGSSLCCHGFVCSLWLWYFLIILFLIEKAIFLQSNGCHLEKWQPFLFFQVADKVSRIEIQYVQSRSVSNGKLVSGI